MFRYKIYEKIGNEFKFKSNIELKSNDSITKKRLAELDKNPDYEVVAEDNESVWFLKKPQRRGRSKLNDNLVVEIFRLNAEESLNSHGIQVKLDEIEGVEVSKETIRNVLNRKIYKDVEIPEKFLNKDITTTRKRRKKISPEDKIKILKLHDNGKGLSGAEISRMSEFDYSDAAITRFLIKELGFMVDGKRG